MKKLLLVLFMSLSCTSMTFAQRIAGFGVKKIEQSIVKEMPKVVVTANTRFNLPDVKVDPIPIISPKPIINNGSRIGEIKDHKIIMPPPIDTTRIASIMRNSKVQLPTPYKFMQLTSTIYEALGQGDVDSIQVFVLPVSKIKLLYVIDGNSDIECYRAGKGVANTKAKKRKVRSWKVEPYSASALAMTTATTLRRDSLEYLEQDVEGMKIQWTMYADNEEFPLIKFKPVREYEQYPVAAGFSYLGFFSDSSEEYCIAMYAMKTVKDDKEHADFADYVKQMAAKSAVYYLRGLPEKKK